MKVITKGRIHINGCLLEYFRNELGKIKLSDLENPPHVSMKQFLNHDDAFEDELLQMEVIGSEEEPMVEGRALLVFGPLSIEVDGRELRRALLPFIGK